VFILPRGVTADDYWARWEAFDTLAKALELAPADRHFAWMEHTSDEEWREWPVPISHFLWDPFYIGTDVNVREMIGEFLGDFFEPLSLYELFIFIAGIGSGKSFSASLAIQYVLYTLSCLRNPQKYMNGFPGVSLSPDSEIVLMNNSGAGAAQAGKIVYGDSFMKVMGSPYFNQFFAPHPRKTSELLFPHRIRLSPGTSHWQSALGFNIFFFVVDEAAFGRETAETDYVKELFLALNQRRKSRFGLLGGGGLFTSPGSEHGFIEKLAGEGMDWDRAVMVRRTTTWDAKGEMVPGQRIFLLDRDPDRPHIIEGTQDLIFQGWSSDGEYGIAQRPTGEIVRWRQSRTQTVREEDQARAREAA
jgi:hypothetical protein